MNILWFLDKEFDVALNVSARLATIIWLKKNHNIAVVTSYKIHKKKYPGVENNLIYLDRLNYPYIKTFYLFFKQIEYLKKTNLNDVDIIMLNSNNIFLLNRLLKLKKKYKYKIVLDIRTVPVEMNSIKKKIYNYLFKRKLKIAAIKLDGVTYITNEMKKKCQKKYNLPEHKNAVWESGVNTSLFRPSQYSNQKDALILMYHGTITINRGIDKVLLAIENLRNYNLEFHLMGTGNDIVRLKNMTHNLKIVDRVIFYENIPFEKVPFYINKIDCGILPFPEYEGWDVSSPLKLFEYLACGKPVIVTKIPAHWLLLKGMRFAFWARKCSVEDISGAILEAFKHKKDFKELGSEARIFIERNYRWEKQISKFEKFLESLL